ncbi:hypothetical protein PoB_007488800 [Plakobranchus ocellatus]|uniref:Secreted protein n=1 Tax=Plakobranchus ocellatus TaxID=259542 RepID=A0AAV4DWA4_9GAST|nr:hypothetical protein PoB_007488800 [Plakobranchus ocellatus]
MVAVVTVAMVVAVVVAAATARRRGRRRRRRWWWWVFFVQKATACTIPSSFPTDSSVTFEEINDVVAQWLLIHLEICCDYLSQVRYQGFGQARACKLQTNSCKQDYAQPANRRGQLQIACHIS